MTELIHQFISDRATAAPKADALYYKQQTLNYDELNLQVQSVAHGLLALDLEAAECVAVYLPKQVETVLSLFGASRAGGVFVPVNPLLKPNQVAYILRDCNVRVLVTSSQRLKLLSEVLPTCHDLNTVVVTEDKLPELGQPIGADVTTWGSFVNRPIMPLHNRIDSDMAAILYTSGSTGNPKGVVLSHKNMVAGAKSVASYLNNSADDRLLAVLPFSFDYGLSQLTTAFLAGASVALMDYLLPNDILNALSRYKVTGLAGVPPIWNQLIQLEWPAEVSRYLRYITNSGGAMPKATTNKLQEKLPDTDIYLMYGLTEAFRSTFLPPDQVSVRPESIGKAIPNVEILVVREDGSECAPGEPGELVHRGSLVAMGYWNDPVKTAERFKPAPGQHKEIPIAEIAVWSGDQVKKDEDGYLYFISRKDEMIKTSGYRVSPTEVEEVVYGLPGIKEVAAFGVPHPELGQAIFVVVSCSLPVDTAKILQHCKAELPSFMVPQVIEFAEQLPKNQNGKIDRKTLKSMHENHFL